jgi:hypothetical protein
MGNRVGSGEGLVANGREEAYHSLARRGKGHAKQYFVHLQQSRERPDFCSVK